MRSLDVEFYCVGRDPQSPRSEEASRGSSCILSLNLTTNKTNEPPGSTEHVCKNATLAGLVTLGPEGNAQGRKTDLNQGPVVLFVQ